MMKERQIGGKLLKSAIAVLLAAAVAVLTLPSFKMDVRAVTDTQKYAVWMGMTSAVVMNVTDIENPVPLEAGASIPSGSEVYVQGAQTAENTVSVSGLTNGQEVQSYADWGQGTLYTLTQSATITSIEGRNVIFTLSGTDSSSAEEPAAPAAAGAAKSDPAAMARTIAEMQARYNAEQAALAQQREADRIYQAKQLQAQIDNRYFKNLNEAKANGKNMVVRPDHSAVKSTVNGNYFATYKNGFAAVALDPLAAPNLFVETWDITSKKSDKAFNSINDWVNENGGTLIGAVQVNIGTKNGKGEVVYESENKDPVANAKFGVPNDGAKYVIVQVLPGGGTNVFENPAIENGVATLPLPIGQAAYGVVKLPQ